MEIFQAIAGIGRNSGGTASFMSDLSGVLSEDGFQFRLLTHIRDGSSPMPITADIRVERLGSFGAREILREIEGLGFTPDLIHYHGIWLPIGRAVSEYCREKQISCVISPHGMLEPWALNHKKWKKRLAMVLFQRRDLRDAVAFHACSKQEALNIRRLGFKQPIAVIPNGVVLPEPAVGGSSVLVPCASLKQGSLEGGGSENEERRTKNQEQRTALFLSRINPKKGLPMLLDAWKRVAPEGWRLIIAGNDDSDHQKVIAAKIRELKLEDQVELVGPLFGEAKEQAFRAADLFVLPSYSENFGIVVTEALSYGVPVLTTTGCPWAELETHRCGWWVEPTPVGIESGLNEALKTKSEELSAMGARGRALVVEKYQWPEIGSKFRRFYSWILEGGEKPDFVI